MPPVASAAPAAPWSRPAADVVARLGSDTAAGLSPAAAADRLAHYGPNELAPVPAPPWWHRMVRQFQNPVVYLLLVAIAVSFVAWVADGGRGAPWDSIVIAVIVFANAGIGYIQEGRAEQAVAALRTLTRTQAIVVRGGQQIELDAALVVPGDILLVGDGDLVSADARVIDAAAARAAEAALTGESEPVSKRSSPTDDDAVVGDRVSMIHSGTAIVAGRVRAVVTATGADTELGRIAELLEETEDRPTPLQREIERVGRLLGVAVVVIAAVVVATLIVLDDLRSGAELTGALLIGLSLAVAAVPEGLPAVLSLVLALGVQRMADRNALVKRLASVATLGSATIICSDKTGTLTRNEMTVRRVVVPSGIAELGSSGSDPVGMASANGDQGPDETVSEELWWALVAGGLAGNVTLDGNDEGADRRAAALGDPTELAIVAAQPKVGIDSAAVADRFRRVAEVPFSSERKRMSTVQVDRERGDELLVVTKGAPDVLLPRCRSERKAGRLVDLSEDRRRSWTATVDDLSGDALRVLAVAYRPLGPVGRFELDERLENDLVLLGVVGIIDPPRPGAAGAVAEARRAGIRVAMITGDHPNTAARIAAELGIADPGDRVVSGLELAATPPGDLADVVADVSIYARVAPEHKLDIVQALNRRGEIVAMTGDGVNDAPALKAADIGVAMGVAGTDVSKEAADMILTDDDFATIVAAIREGRGIFHNIRSFLRYLLSSNVGEVLTIFLGVVLAAPLGLVVGSGDEIATPLLAVQILWINLVTDAAPALALGVDPPQQSLMDRGPRPPDAPVVDRRMRRSIAALGLTMAVVTLAMLDGKLPGGLIEGSADLTSARTAAFTTLVLAQLFNTLNARSDTASCWGELTTNPWLVGAVGLSLGLQVLVVHLPALHEPFGTTALSVGDWALAVALASCVLVVGEVRKAWLRGRTRPDDHD